MPIRINGEPMEFREGMTVEDVLREKKFSFSLKTVFVNGQMVPRSDYASAKLKDGDDVQAIHLMSGG